MLEIKIPKNIRIIIFTPQKIVKTTQEKNIENYDLCQWIIIKGKYGQYKLTSFLKYQELLKKDFNITDRFFGINSIMPYNTNDKTFIYFPKEEKENKNYKSKKKHFIYDKKTKKIYDRDIFVSTLDNLTTLNKQEKYKKLLQGKDQEKVLDNKVDRIYFGATIIEKKNCKNNTSKIQENKEMFDNSFSGNQKIFIELEKRYFKSFQNLSNKNLKKKQQEFHNLSTIFKQIFLGISQGFTLNIELNGVGYNATITQGIQESAQESLGNVSQKDKRLFDKIEYLYGLFLIIPNALNKPLPSRGNYDIQKWPKSSIWKSQILDNKILNLSLGISHQIQYKIPENDVKISCRSSNSDSTSNSNLTNLLTLFGISNNIITQIAANIYKIKKPDSYKGIGIRYDGLNLIIKSQKKKK